MRLFPLWVLLLLASATYGQSPLESRIDSLKEAARNSEGISKASSLNELGWAFRKFAPDSTIFYAQQALDISRELNYKRGETLALSYIGVAHKYLTRPDKALSFFRKAMDIAEQSQDTVELAYSFNNIASIYQNQGDYPEAYRNYEKALALFEMVNDEDGIAYVYSGLSEAYEGEGNNPQAIAACRQAIQVRRELGPPTSLASELLRLAELLIKERRNAEALSLLEEAKQLSKDNGMETLSAMSNVALARFYEQDGNLEKALVYAEKATQQYRNVENPYEAIQGKILRAKLYLRLGRLNDADAELANVLRKAKKNKYIYIEVEAYGLRSKLHELRNDYRMALHYHKLYLSGKDSIEARENQKTVQRLQRNLAIMQKERELERLRQKEFQNQAKMKREQTKTLGLTILLALVLFLAFMLIRNNQTQKKANAMLNQQKNQIESQHEAIQQKNERLEVANLKLEEINQEKDSLMGIVAHDLKSPLNKVKGYTQILQMLGNLKGEEKKIVEGIDEVVEGGRRLIQDLLDIHTAEYHDASALKVESVPLSEMLQGIIRGFNASAQQKGVEVIYTDPGHEVEIESDSSSLGRIFENLISNAIKFTEPGRKVFVSLHDNEGRAQVMIRDEGPGFTAEDQERVFQKFQKLSAKPTGGESSTGLGLAIVKLLLEQTRGQISLYSRPGEGSEFIVELPRTLRH